MPPSSDVRPALDWRIDVPLLTEPLYLVGYAKAITIALVMMGTLLSFLVVVTDNSDAIGAMWALTGLCMAIFIVAGGLGTLVLTGNRLSLTYAVDERGVVQTIVDRKVRAVSGVAVAAGVLAGNAGTVGAGMLARSQNRRAVAWKKLVSARFHPGGRAVSLRNSWRTLLIVFCPDAVYEDFVAQVKERLAERAADAPTPRNPLPGLLLRTLVAVLTCLPFFVLPWPFELDLLAPLLTLCFALAAVWLVPHLGVVAIGGMLWMWFDIAGRALGERQSTLDGSTYRILDTMRGDEWMPLIIAAAGSLILLLLGISLIQGRFQTALADDGDEIEPDDPAKPAGDTD